MAKTKTTPRPRRLGDNPRAPRRPQPGRGPAASATTVEPIVLDDLPNLIPVTGPELEVIEIYLSSLIEGLLEGATPTSAAKPVFAANSVNPTRASRPIS